MISLNLIVIVLLHESKMIADSYQLHTKEINEYIHTFQFFIGKRTKKKNTFHMHIEQMENSSTVKYVV